MDNMMSTDSLDSPSQASSTHFGTTTVSVRRRSKMACDTCHYRKIKCNVERCYPCKNCEKNSVQCTMVGPSMRPPRSISGSSSAAAAAAVAMAMATVANARLAGGNVGGYNNNNFEGPLDQDGNPAALFRTMSLQADDRNRLATARVEDYQSMGVFNPLWTRAGISARGPDVTGSRSVDLATASHHRKLHGYSSQSPTIPPSSRSLFLVGAPSIYSPTDPLSGYTRVQHSPPLTVATTSRYVSTLTPGAHEMITDPKRVNGYDYFNLPLTHSTASTPSVTSPSFTTTTRGFSQLSLIDDSSLSTSLPPTPSQSHIEKYGDGFDPSSLYKAPAPLYPTQTSQPPHRLNGQSVPLQHKQIRTASISPHPQGRELRHQPFGFPDRRSSLPWDARISSHSGSLDNRGGSKGSRQQHGSSTPSVSTVHGYKGRERSSFPQPFLVRSNSTPAIFGLPSVSAGSMELQQQGQQQVNINSQGWHTMRPRADYEVTTTPAALVERSPQDLISATRPLRCTLSQQQQQSSEYTMEAHGQVQARGSAFERPFHSVQDIHESHRGPVSSSSSCNSSTGEVSRPQEQQEMSLTMSSPFSPPNSQVHRPSSHPLVFSTMDHGRDDAASQQQQYQSVQHQSQPSQHGQQYKQHPLSLKVEDLENDTFDSSLAMVLEDHLSLMDHLNMMPDVEVYQSQISSSATLMRPMEQQQQQQQQQSPHHHPNQQEQQQHQEQLVQNHRAGSFSGSVSISNLYQQRLQAPLSAPAISTHQGLFVPPSDLYPTTAANAVRSAAIAEMSETSSIPSPVSPEDPAVGGGQMVLIKQEFGNHIHHQQQQQKQQQQHPMLYFDNSALVLNNGLQSAGSAGGSAGGGESFGHVQDTTTFMQIKVEPDLELNHQLHNQHQQQPISSSSASSAAVAAVYYTMDRQHPFDAEPMHHHHHHHHQQQQQNHQQHNLQVGRPSHSAGAAITTTTIGATHGVPILVAEYHHRPHQQQQQ